jgi:dTDP-4-amino-4,6-dideoxygalactose transaminase
LTPLSYYHNTAALPIFQEFFSPCPNADATAKELVYLPSYPRCRSDQVDQNIQIIRDFFKK